MCHSAVAPGRPDAGTLHEPSSDGCFGSVLAFLNISGSLARSVARSVLRSTVRVDPVSRNRISVPALGRPASDQPDAKPPPPGNDRQGGSRCREADRRRRHQPARVGCPRSRRRGNIRCSAIELPQPRRLRAGLEPATTLLTGEVALACAPGTHSGLVASPEIRIARGGFLWKRSIRMQRTGRRVNDGTGRATTDASEMQVKPAVCHPGNFACVILDMSRTVGERTRKGSARWMSRPMTWLWSVVARPG